MKKISILIFVILGSLLFGDLVLHHLRHDIDGDDFASLQASVTGSRQNAITRAVEKVSPAVVGINVTQMKRYYQRHPFADDPFFRNFFPDIPVEQKVQSLGSGVIFDKNGYVLTNQHVIENATEIIVTMTGGKQFNAEIIGEDHKTDVAVLKIKGSNFPTAVLGQSNDVIIGEWVIALGILLASLT